jgi:hypothetical protein
MKKATRPPARIAPTAGLLYGEGAIALRERPSS